MDWSVNTRRAGCFSRTVPALAMAAAALLYLCSCSNGTIAATNPSPSPPSPTAPPPKLVAYLPDYHQSYALYAKSQDLSHLTHLLLAFGHAPLCNGNCTASSDMTITMQQQTDASIDAMVTAAHQAGVKVMISLGGGDVPGDATFAQFYNAGLSKQLAASVNSFVTAHSLDGVDVDIEDTNNMGAPYGDFVQALADVLHPESKVLSATMAPSMQKAIPDSVLGNCDFINVLTFSTDAQAISDLQYYSQTKSVPAAKIVLGVPLFGRNADQSLLESYAAILTAYPNAWQTDQVSGGSLDGGVTLYYVGESTMAKETKLGVQYGGVMVWELSQDAAAPHSLLNIIETNL